MKKKTDELSFTYESVMKELDKYRAPLKSKDVTPEQKNFILSCRENQRQVPFPKMVELWKKMGWGETTHCALRNMHDRLKNG